MAHKPNFIARIFHTIWSLFLNGLFTILPLTMTLALFNVSFKLITSWLEPVKTFISPEIIKHVPYAEFMVVILLIFLIGTIMRVLVLRSLIHTLEDIVGKMPLISPVYTGIKQLVQAFSLQDKITFKKVVVVEFPRTGIYSLGFMTSELPPEIAPKAEQKFYNVFIPTTPNPTSEYFVMLAEDQIEIIDLTRQEAMAMIISGGIIQPERLVKK